MKKVCPILTGSVLKDSSKIKYIPCIKEDCQLWITTFTIENIEYEMCVFEATARRK